MVDHGWCLTEHEHADDAYEDEGDVLLVSALAHLGTLTLSLFERCNQLEVQEAETQERSTVHHDHVHDVSVEDPVDLVAAELADVEAVARLVVPDAVFDLRVLEEARNVVDDREHGDGGDVQPHLALGARPDGDVRPTYGEVSLQRHENREKDRAGVGD